MSKNLLKTVLVICGIYAISFSNAWACNNQPMSAQEEKQLVKDAVVYALENPNPDMDYSKFVSKDFMNAIDGNTFNYKQWVTHQKNIKKMIKSMTPTFNLLVAEGNYVSAIFRIHLVKKDGSELEVEDLGFFKIKNHKIVYVKELTRLIQGNNKDKDISSTK